MGEKETSEQAEIVRRYADLFSREQLDALREAEAARPPASERELLYRLRKTCEGGLIADELVERHDELENRMLAARVTFEGEELPLRTAQAQLAVLAGLRGPRGAGRDPGRGERRASTTTGWRDRRRRGARRPSSPASPIAVERNEEEKGSRCASSRPC